MTLLITTTTAAKIAYMCYAPIAHTNARPAHHVTDVLVRQSVQDVVVHLAVGRHDAFPACLHGGNRRDPNAALVKVSAVQARALSRIYRKKRRILQILSVVRMPKHDNPTDGRQNRRSFYLRKCYFYAVRIIPEHGPHASVAKKLQRNRATLKASLSRLLK